MHVLQQDWRGEGEAIGTYREVDGYDKRPRLRQTARPVEDNRQTHYDVETSHLLRLQLYQR